MMKRLWILLPTLLATTLFADEDKPKIDPMDQSQNQRLDSFQKDIEEVKAWMRAKRQISIKERGGDLSLSGDVRSKFAAVSEKRSGVKQRGPGGRYPNIPTNRFGVGVNLYLNYVAEKTWANIKIGFDNIAGVDNGTVNRLKIDRAFVGARAYSGETYTMDLEFGRRKLNYTFDSRVQFASMMDGILFKYNQASEDWGDFYLYGGPFVVKDTSSLFAYVFEGGVFRIANTGFFAKYSLIDWDTRNYSNFALEHKYAYFISQFSGGYTFTPPGIDKLTTLYYAFLINSGAQGVPQTYNRKDNLAWYLGFTIGAPRKQSDWAINWNFQWVAPQSVPQFDMAGIGTGNAGGSGFYTTDGTASSGITTAQSAGGNTNYYGWTANFLYLFTDNLTLSQTWAQSRRLRDNIGPPFQFKGYTMELIYAF